jgi:uncharacterized protein YdaU (DUF1376 family)
MHYYQHHIGDYKAATAHLTNEEDLAYRRLIEMYYDTEAPIPVGVDLCRKLRTKAETVSIVLDEFFIPTEAGWIHARCETEIAAYQSMKKGGKDGADKRWGKGAYAPPIATESPAQSLPNANHEPVTSNQLIHTSADKLPTCPTQEIIDLYNKILPELPAVRIVNDKRKRDAKKFWHFVLTSEKSDGTPRAATAEQALEWIGAYFLRAKDNDFVMGRIHKSGEHANWIGDFDYLMTDKGITQVIEKTREAA